MEPRVPRWIAVVQLAFSVLARIAVFKDDRARIEIAFSVAIAMQTKKPPWQTFPKPTLLPTLTDWTLVPV
jgi:hypothetical protein